MSNFLGIEGGLWRKIFLVACLVCYVAMQTFWVLGGHWGFFWCFIFILVSVLIWEVINTLLIYKKTLSTEVTKKIEGGGKLRIYMYLATLFMSLSIGFLHLHLVWQ